jgi:hypothetical protein
MLYIELSPEAMCANAKVVPVAHCWENDLLNMGGFLVYVGADNDGTQAVEIPSGESNYMNGAHVPPTFFPTGLNAFMRKVAFANGGTVDWILNDGTTSWEVTLSTNAPMNQCNMNAPVFVTFHFNAPQGTFQQFSAQQLTAFGDRLVGAVYNAVHYPYAYYGAWNWASTTNGFTATVELLPRQNSPTQFETAADIIGMAGDQAVNQFTSDVNNAFGLPNVSVTHLSSNGTGANVYGVIRPPLAPVQSNPGNTPAAPSSVDPSTLIPYADCWERNGTTLWFYFGYNNTAPTTSHVPAGSSNFAQTIPDGSSKNVITTFTPGFSSFALAIALPNMKITQSGAIEWYILTHYVRNIVRGSSGECRPAEGTNVWIYFNGNFPVIANLPQQLEAVVAEQIPGIDPAQISINTNGVAPIWRIEISISRGPVSPARAASYLYNAFYNNPAFATKLENLAQATPTSLHGQATSTELAGSTRPSPLAPYSVPVLVPVKKHLSGGAIFGIIVGVVAGIALIGVVVWYLRKSSMQGQGGFEKLIQ